MPRGAALLTAPEEAKIRLRVRLRQAAREVTEPDYAADPVGFIQEKLGEPLWSKQRQIAEAVRDHRRVAVHSAHATGKSFLASRIVSWWLTTHKPGEAFCVTTAPTAQQVRAILWREINRAHAKGNLPGRTTQTEWRIGEELVAFGRKPADYDPSAFQGIHSRYVLVVIDEACHDELTEVMTESGWQRFSALTGAERLLTMDPDSHEAEYVLPVRLIRKPYRGPMVEYRAHGADFCVTPDHEMLYRPKMGHIINERRYGAWRKAPIGSMLQYKAGYQLPRTFKWIAADQDIHTIPAHSSDRKSWPARVVPMDDWLTFLGWYCSEGSLVKGRGRVVGVNISQRDPSTLSEIYALSDRLGLSPKIYPTDVRIHSMQIGAHLAEIGTGALTKHVPQYVREVSARQIGLFLDAYVRGDGYQRDGGRQIIYTSSPKMADDLQELVLKTGVDSVIRPRILAGRSVDFGTHIGTSSVDGFVISRTARATHLKFQHQNAQMVDYNGTVYCATLPKHHVLLTRRHGYAVWSGNCGVPIEIYQSAASLGTNEYARMLAIGNPDNPQSHFSTVCKPGSGWHVIRVNGLESPNFTDEEVPDSLRELLIGPTYVAETLADGGGEESPLYVSKVLGLFPENALDGVVLLSWVRACQRLEAEPGLPVELGMDVGAGGDETNLRERRGVKAGRKWNRRTPNFGDAVAMALDVIKETGATRIKVDAIGIGWGVVGRLAELRQEGIHQCEVIPVNVGAASFAPERFPRLRDQLWWEVGRELSRSGGWDLTDVDETTIAQLIAPKYARDSAGRIKIEPKADTRKALGRSPDDGDSLLLSYYTPPVNLEGVLW